MIYVLANVYQAMPDLTRMWDSVRTHMPDSELCVVDGKYPDFRGAEEVSTDGTREFARRHGHLVTSVDYECEKRTAGLRHIDTLAEDGDFILYLDADEEITAVFGKPERVGNFVFQRAHSAVSYDRCRMYRWEPGLEFRNRHYDLWLGDELVASLDTAPEFQTVGLGVHHEQVPRPREKALYYRSLRRREGHPAEAVRA